MNISRVQTIGFTFPFLIEWSANDAFNNQKACFDVTGTIVMDANTLSAEQLSAIHRTAK